MLIRNLQGLYLLWLAPRLIPNFLKSFSTYSHTQRRKNILTTFKMLVAAIHIDFLSCMSNCQSRLHALSTLFIWRIRSTTRQLYPNSLSYQDTSFMKLLFNAMPALASKILLFSLVMKSEDTTRSSV